MASIPLPALGVRPPEQPNLLGEAGQAVQLGNLLQARQFQQQAQPLQIQAQQQENQQREVALKDQAAQTAAMKDWDGKNLQDLPGLLLKHGGSATAVFGLKSKILEQQTSLTKLDTDTLANQAKKNDYLLGSLQAATSGPDEGLSDRVNAAALDAVKKGYLDQQHAQGIQQLTSQIQDPKALRDQLGTMEKSFMGQKEQFDQEAKSRELKSKEDENALKAQEFQTSGAMADSRYRNYQMSKQLGRPTTPEDAAFAKAYEKQKELNTVTRFQLQNGGGGLIPQGGAGNGAPPTIDGVPGSIRGTVKQILDYRGPMPSSGRNNPTNTAIRYWVNQLDPTYDESSFPARNKILNSYTSGPESKSINAINTALGHLGELGEAAKALDQNDVPLLHSIASKLGSATGGSAATVYQGILHRVGPEMTAAYVQGGGGEGERGANQSDFDISKGAKQITDNIAESAKLLRSKIGAQEKQWDTTFKPTKDEDKFENRFITPAAKATLDEYSAKAPTSKSSAAPSKPANATHTGVGSLDKKKHWLDASGKDLGLAE